MSLGVESRCSFATAVGSKRCAPRATATPAGSSVATWQRACAPAAIGCPGCTTTGAPGANRSVRSRAASTCARHAWDVREPAPEPAVTASGSSGASTVPAAVNASDAPTIPRVDAKTATSPLRSPTVVAAPATNTPGAIPWGPAMLVVTNSRSGHAVSAACA